MYGSRRQHVPLRTVSNTRVMNTEETCICACAFVNDHERRKLPACPRLRCVCQSQHLSATEHLIPHHLLRSMARGSADDGALVAATPSRHGTAKRTTPVAWQHASHGSGQLTADHQHSRHPRVAHTHQVLAVRDPGEPGGKARRGALWLTAALMATNTTLQGVCPSQPCAKPRGL